MQKLLSELTRLYVQPGALSPEAFRQHMQDAGAFPLTLAAPDGSARVLAIPFNKTASGDTGHWARLCTTANALQAELGFPAPAVSISGAGFGLWLSFEQSVPAALLRELTALLQQTYFPEGEAASVPLDLPPCTHGATGLWAAFIHPDLGASFADEPWLEMAPPEHGQVSLIEHLESIGHDTFLQALATLRANNGALPVVAAPAKPGLLLADATLEDIVRHLHAKHIEPTFKHLIR